MALRFCSVTSFLIFFFFFFVNLVSHSHHAELIPEDGYTVTTLIDGHKLEINPRSVTPRPGSSDLIVLDSSRNRFYTVSFPGPQAAVTAFSGDGKQGYADGESGSAQFNHPKSFAVDTKGNIYVADKVNHAIRKISSSGVTTIAGGYSQLPGKEDGPGKNATFSNDIEVVFVAQKCALLISDHGNQLIRQIDIKPEDCATGSQHALGAVWIWGLGLGMSCLIGLVVGIAIRPYVIRNERSSPLRFSETWKHCLIHPVRIARTLYFDIRSAVASSGLYALWRRLLSLSLSQPLLMFRINSVGPCRLNKNINVSVLDADVDSYEVEYQKFVDQLKGLITFDGFLQPTNSEDAKWDLSDGGIHKKSAALVDGTRTIESMIQASFIGFAEEARGTTPVDCPLVGSLGLVKRR